MKVCSRLTKIASMKKMSARLDALEKANSAVSSCLVELSYNLCSIFEALTKKNIVVDGENKVPLFSMPELYLYRKELEYNFEIKQKETKCNEQELADVQK